MDASLGHPPPRLGEALGFHQAVGGERKPRHACRY